MTNIIAGAVGGLIGTFLIGTLMKKQQALPEPLRGPQMKEHPGELMAREVESVVGNLSEATKGRLSNALQFAYGIFWPTLLGAIAKTVRLDRSVGRALLSGAGLGALVWAIGYVGWLPAIGLTQPVHEQGASHVASSIAGHVGYGVASAVPLAVASKLRN